RLQLDQFPPFRHVRSARCNKKSRPAQALIELAIIHRKRFYASNTSIGKRPAQSPNPAPSANSERWQAISENRRECLIRLNLPPSAICVSSRLPIAVIGICRISPNQLEKRTRHWHKATASALWVWFHDHE